MFFRKLYYTLTPGLRRWVRRIFYLPADMFWSLSVNSDKLVPPKGMIFTGSGDFIGQGDLILSSILRHCDLKPDGSVLDIGCGIGRVARPMANFLNPEGLYIGFDIVKTGIDWCSANYKKYPNFRFQHIPLKNDLYNLSTEEKASSFSFPYPSEKFDLVVLTSVFTHMQKPEVQQYMNEICRVLKKDKYCFCTFFTITPESDNFLKISKNPFFKYRHEDFYLHNSQVKDANIAYKYEVLQEMLSKSGLRIKSFHPGWWAGLKKEQCENFQDIMIITTINRD